MKFYPSVASKRRPTLLSLILFHIASIILIAKVEETECQIYYRIPSPFNETSLKSKSYYVIKSYQTTVSSHKKKTQLLVEEYSSLYSGLTFSLHKNQDDLSQSYLLINDGPNSRYYIVRNPNIDTEQDAHQNEDENGMQLNLAVNCELDHLHHHQRIFPWQFIYDIKDTSDAEDTEEGSLKKYKRRKKKKGWSTKRSVYGVIGIWLNAIERKIVSKDVGELSPYSGTNIWMMRDNDIEVQFLFEKPSESAEPGDPMQKLLNSTMLDSIHLDRTPLIESDQDMGDLVVPNHSFDIIQIKSFQSNVDSASASFLKQFQYQLARCRKENRATRLFPSLIRAVNMSPDRMYAIHYLEHKFGTLSVGEGRFDESKHRHVRNIELQAEWFSFPLETQVFIYEGVPEYPNPEDKVHVFLRKFTERGEKLKTHSDATVNYHLVEGELGIENCTVGEFDPTFHWFKLLNRHVHFYQPSGTKLTGLHSGLGALLINAAESNHKQFNLFKREISVAYDATNLKARRKIRVDEWKLIDEKSGRSVQFYFKQSESELDDHRISDLVRIDIRDLIPHDQAPAVEDAAQDDLDDYDLVARYDILKLDLLKSESEINFIFSKPQICDEQKTDFSSTSRPEEDKDWHTETNENESDYHHVSIDSDSDEAEDMADNEKDQNDGEDFEFEAGTYTVSSSLPDILNYIEGHESTYGFLSTITLADPNEEVKSGNKKIYMKETVNLSTNLARISVFYSQSSLSNSTPDLDYYINYNSEIMLEYTSPHCSIVDEFQPWLRLFSSEVTYYKTNAIHTSITEGDMIRMYGVSALWRQATESPYTDFLGAKRKLVNDTEGNSYRELIWSQMEDNDSNMELRFKFLLNVTSKANELDDNPLQLDSIYIYRLFDDDEYNGKFRKFVVTEPKMFLVSDITLPGSCMGILRNHKSGGYASSKVELPGLEKFLYSSYGYTAHYIVTQAADRDSPNEKLVSYQVTESYDRHLDYGRFTIGNGPETREIFINSKNNTLYMFAMGICKHVRNLHGLVDVQSEFLTDDTDYEAGKLYGLAQLLTQIAKKKDFVLEAEINHDATGNRYERRIYRNKGELITSGAKKVVYIIELIFIARPNVNAVDDNNEHYELVRIEFSPYFFSSERRTQIQNMHRTTIEILNITKRGFDKSWYLPEECEKLDKFSAPFSKSSQKFPILSALLGQSGFYIRSEISSSNSIQGEIDKTFILDEWKLDRSLRLKSFGLKKNLDLIIYGLTKESFDLSTNYRCSNELPLLRTEYRNNGKKSLLDLFSKNITFVESLSELYYSPIALWHLAENNPATVSLSNSVELAPLAKSGSLLDHIEREMKSETWLVQNPMAKWSYEMIFELHSQMLDNKTLTTWHVLSKIKVIDFLKSNLVEGEKRTVDIDIVNYRYRNRSEIMQKNLRLPEGFGCVRSREVLEDYKTINDDLLLDRNKPYYIWYEASLEKVKKSYNDPNLGSITLSRGVLPTVTGTFMKSADSIKVAPYLDIRIHYSSMRLLNGTRTTTKTVMDETNDLVFKIDRKSGQCQIGRRENKDWTIEFADEVGVQKLRIDEYMFLALFSPNTTTFNPLNRYTDEFGRSVNEYEDPFYSMKLTDKLEGPVSVIRRFEQAEDERLPFLIKDLNIVKFHSSVLVKVMLFNLARTDLEAVLYFNLRLVTPIHLSEFIEHMNVASCYTDDTRKPTNQIRTFAVEYECQQPNRENFDSELFKDKFLTQLIMNSHFLPSQLSGPLIMDYDDNFLIKLSFNALDPPTSLEFNTRFLAQSRMTLDMELKAEVKLVSSIWDCSMWCDHIGCVAMSYCSDHTCRVITPNILINGTDSRYLNKKEVLPLINSVVDSDCTYLYRVGKRPRTVQSFADFMDVSLNSKKNLTEFRLETNKFCSTINPTKFYEIKDQFDLIKEDLDEVNQNENTYLELKKDYKLDDTKLEELSVNFKSLIKQPVSSYSDCMSACNLKDCSLFSYCKEQSLCSIVVGSGDLKVLESALKQADEKLACTTSVLDFLDSYNRFDYTKQPTEFETKLEDYTSLECAAMCDDINGNEQYTFDCMSFDICLDKENLKSTCYLHKEHVMSDSFDRRIFDPKSFDEAISNANEASSNPGSDKSCQHFSKSVLSDYVQLKNKGVTGEEVQSVKGYSAERCALDCQDDDQCYAFEYCFDDTKQPVQSCYFIRTNEENPSLDNPEYLQNYLTESSKPSIKCSIYVLKHFPEQYLVDENSQNSFIRATSQLILKHNTLISTILKLLFYLFSSIIIGIAIQFSYRKLLGRSITVNCIG